MRWGRAVSALVLACVCSTLPGLANADTGAVRSEADWILSTQLTDGAITTQTDHTAVWPYLANFAAIGLARATSVTRDKTYVRAARRWLRWYGSHESPRGFVTDYEVTGGREVTTGDMDSSDAYAGTYLLAVWNVWRVDRNLPALRALRPTLRGAVRAIASTTDADGLTWAKPSWHVKYLLDESETYAGLRAAQHLFVALNDRRSASRVAARARRIRSAAAALWNPSTASFDWAVHSDGVHQTTDWTNLYPDALEQLWPIAFGLSDPSRTGELLAHFTSAHPAWDDPSSATNYWPVAGWAFDAGGEASAASSGASEIRAAAMSASRAWPYTSGTAGQMIVLITGGPARP